MTQPAERDALVELPLSQAPPPFIDEGATYRNKAGDGQEFRAVDVVPHIRRNGEPSQIVTWESQCAVCGAFYQVKGGRRVHNLAVTCPAHRGKSPRRSTRAKAERQRLRSAIRAALGAIGAGDTEKAQATLAAALARPAGVSKP